MHKRAVWIVYFFGICALVVTNLWGADQVAPAPVEANPARLSITTERVVIFKDGYGLFIKAATATADKDGVVFTDSVPDGAVLGCFWATADGKNAIGMRAEFDERNEERVKETACLTVLELLRANKGKKATLTLSSDKAVTVNGTIADVLELAPEKEKEKRHRITIPSPNAIYRANVNVNELEENEEYPRETIRELAPTGGVLAVIDDTPQGRMVLPVSDIRSVAGAELVTRMSRHEEVKTKSKRLSFDLGKDAAGQPAKLHILYFAEGVRWIPTYRVSGALEDNAEIALQGEIVNEAEDISNAALDLVVGVPNFRFKNTISPLSLEANLRLALNTAAPAMASNDFSNAIYSQQAATVTTRRAPEAAGGGMNLAPELAAGGAQDLFVYGTKTFSLKKYARATVPLWQSTSALRHVYTLDVKEPEYNDGQRRGFETPASPLTLAKSKVWHQYELTNSSTSPWTTGSALILKNNLPLGQELMTYTPAGARTLLPVTVAVDMTGDHQEKETGRTPNALRVDGYDYTLIQKHATISIDNFRKEKSITRVTFQVTGKADKASDAGKIEINDRRSNVNFGDPSRANNESTVSWDLVIEPGTCKVLTVDYSYYSR